MASTSAAPIRRLIYGGSTRSGTLSTGDLEWFASNGGANVYLQAEQAAYAEAAAHGEIASRAVGDLKIDYGDLSARYGAIGKQLHRRGILTTKPFAGGIEHTFADTAATDSDYKRPSFEIARFDNRPGSDSTE